MGKVESEWWTLFLLGVFFCLHNLWVGRTLLWLVRKALGNPHLWDALADMPHAQMHRELENFASQGQCVCNDIGLQVKDQTDVLPSWLHLRHPWNTTSSSGTVQHSPRGLAIYFATVTWAQEISSNAARSLAWSRHTFCLCILYQHLSFVYIRTDPWGNTGWSDSPLVQASIDLMWPKFVGSHLPTQQAALHGDLAVLHGVHRLSKAGSKLFNCKNNR